MERGLSSAVISALICLAGGGCMAPPSSLEERRLYRVEQGVIVDRDGHVLLLRSVNFSGQAKNTEDHLFDFQASDIELLLESGINSVRMLTFWKAVTPDAPDVVDEGYLAAFAGQVDELTAAGLYVVIDMHQDLWGVPFAPHGAPERACPPEVTAGYEPTGAWWTNYTTPQVTGCFDLFWEDLELQGDFAQAWTEVAAAVCHNEQVVGFDLMNEPYPGSALFDEEWDNTVLMPFYERLMGAIDAVCPGRLYFVEHGAGFVIGWGNPLVVPDELRDRVVFAGHFYPQEIHEPSGGGYSGDAEDLEDRLWRYIGTHVENGTAIWIGEYGGMTDSANFDVYLQDLHGLWASYNISSALWDYSRGDGGFAFLDAQGNRKAVFDGVYLTPAPTLLPSEPVQSPDWANRSITLSFDCVVGRAATLLFPSAGCSCEALPADTLEPVPTAAGFSSASCLRDAAVELRCACPLD
ncbi:MAG: cellulase family glycosylhydrolase [bacterium]